MWHFSLRLQVLMESAVLFAELQRAEQEMVEWTLAEKRKARKANKALQEPSIACVDW